MPSNYRKSQHSKEKKGKRGRTQKFDPDLKEWTEACEIYAYDKQIAKHFDICQETFYVFLDRQRYAEEQGNPSEFLAAYKNGRNKTRKFAITNILKLAQQGEVAASIFAAKTYGELIEAKDIAHIELKKKEVELKTKSFLTELANKFNLNPEQLEKFAQDYFEPIE